MMALPRATLHRHRMLQPVATGAARRSKSHRRLSDCERRAIRDVAHSERFADLSVREIYATLLDEGTYLGSISTMYRVLRRAGETRERRRLATHPARVKPELAASAPRQVWCWDITKLLGPQKWTYDYLYVVIDVYSRYVTGWRLEHRESAAFAEELFATMIAREGVNPRQLTVHSDGGTTKPASFADGSSLGTTASTGIAASG
jgi:putative transposase